MLAVVSALGWLFFSFFSYLIDQFTTCGVPGSSSVDETAVLGGVKRLSTQHRYLHELMPSKYRLSSSKTKEGKKSFYSARRNFLRGLADYLMQRLNIARQAAPNRRTSSELAVVLTLVGRPEPNTSVAQLLIFRQIILLQFILHTAVYHGNRLL
jgi:hypothetical protein